MLPVCDQRSEQLVYIFAVCPRPGLRGDTSVWSPIMILGYQLGHCCDAIPEVLC
jgi:hypothetical protein